MLQFPLFRFIPRPSQKTAQTGFIYRFRRTLAFGLAALLFGAPLSFGVSARSLTAKRPIPVVRKSKPAIKPQPAIVHNHPGGAEAHSKESKTFSNGYIIEMIGGKSTCRNATRTELRLMRLADRNQRLYPVKRRMEQRREYDFLNHASKPSAQSSATGLKINFRESEQLKTHPDRAKVIAGFQRAAAVWEGLIKNPISIIIDIDYGTKRFGEDFCPPNTTCFTLGSTYDGESPGRTFPGVRSLLKASASSQAETTLYDALPAGTTVPTNIGPANFIIVPRALARAIGLSGFGPDATDATEPFDVAPSIGFNSAFPFDFNPDDGIESLKTDFEAVAVHEIGHALGFTSFVSYNELVPGEPTVLSVWDLFRFAPGVNLSSFPTANRWLSTGNAPDGNPVFFNNMGAGLQVSTGNLAGVGGDGEQASHWKDGRGIGIMDPTITRGVRQTVKQNDLDALETLGYNLGNSNLPPPPPPPPPPANDNFASAQILSTCSGSVTGTNVSATKESSEPVHPYSTSSMRSVWYQLQSPLEGLITIDTKGSDFDTILAVYAIDSLGKLAQMAVNDDDAEDPNTPEHDTYSLVTFKNFTPGTIYYIAVNGYDNDKTGGDTGNIKLNWIQSSGCVPPTPTYRISGRVSNSNGFGVAGVVINLPGTTAAITDGNGEYSFPALPEGGTYTLTPSYSAAHSFVPGSQTVVSLNSNQTLNFIIAAAVNPIDENNFFVRQHYLDFLDREPEADGFKYWTDILNGCGTDFNCLNSVRVEISSRFFIELEFQRTGFYVMRLYQASYGQPPSFAQFLADRRLVQNSPESQKLFASQWVGRAAFLTEFPANLTQTQFVTKLYDRAGVADPSARTAAIQALTNNTKTRSLVLWELVERVDYQAKEYNPAFVRMMYFGYLRREVEAGGFSYWMNVLTNLSPNNYRSMICGFVNAGEYQLRFNGTRGKFTELNCIW